MNLTKLSFISILAVTTVATAFAATTGGLRHQPIETPGEESVIALSDMADEDGAAHHVVDALDIIIDAGLACAGRLQTCYWTTDCCSSEE